MPLDSLLSAARLVRSQTGGSLTTRTAHVWHQLQATHTYAWAWMCPGTDPAHYYCVYFPREEDVLSTVSIDPAGTGCGTPRGGMTIRMNDIIDGTSNTPGLRRAVGTVIMPSTGELVTSGITTPSWTDTYATFAALAGNKPATHATTTTSASPPASTSGPAT